MMLNCHRGGKRHGWEMGGLSIDQIMAFVQHHGRKEQSPSPQKSKHVRTKALKK